MPTDTTLPTVAQRFATDTADHVLRVALDEGVHRRLVMRNPDSGAYWYDIVTWPGHLAFSGDIGAFVFRWYADDDVLGFFGSVNPHYVGQKVEAGRDEVQRYSETKARANVTQAIRDGMDYDSTLAHDFDRSTEKAIAWFWQNEPYGLDATNEHDVRERLNEASDYYRVFDDAWDWDLRDYSDRFLWALHAIKAARSAYLSTKEAPDA